VALQVGLQPLVTRTCTSEAVSTKSLVLAENAITAVIALTVTAPGAFVGWSILESLSLAGPPAMVYAIRSLCKQSAYRHCDGVTFNIINQTKTVFCAVAAWLLLGEIQTLQQCAALLCAVTAGALLVLPSAPRRTAETSPGLSIETIRAFAGRRTGKDSPPPEYAGLVTDSSCISIASGKEEKEQQRRPARDANKENGDLSKEVDEQKSATKDERDLQRCSAKEVHKEADAQKQSAKEASQAASHAAAECLCVTGLGFAVATAVCSGVAAALSQSAFQRAGSRPSTLFTLELAVWGAPFAILFGGSSNGHGTSSKSNSALQALRGWRLRTLAPVALQAIGGILVGAVVKQHGGVAMGLCTILGIVVSAIADGFITGRPPSTRQILAGMLAAMSVVAHQA